MTHAQLQTAVMAGLIEVIAAAEADERQSAAVADERESAAAVEEHQAVDVQRDDRSLLNTEQLYSDAVEAFAYGGPSNQDQLRYLDRLLLVCGKTREQFQSDIRARQNSRPSDDVSTRIDDTLSLR